MKCEMADCKKKAKLKISMSGSGKSQHYCYRHSFMFVKAQMQRLGEFDFGIYIQRPPTREQVQRDKERLVGISQRAVEEVVEIATERLKADVEANDDWNF